MTLTIVLSGPKSSRSQARAALSGAGFEPLPTDHDHGLAPSTKTEWSGDRYTDTVKGHHAKGDIVPGGEIVAVRVRQPQAFVTVEGDDVNRAHAAVEPLGWQLRAHHETPPPEPTPEPSALEARFAAMQAEIDALKGRIG